MSHLDQHHQLSQTEVEAQFRDFLREQGVELDERTQIVADGRKHGIDLAGHSRGNHKAYYTLHADGTPNGWVGCQKLFGDGVRKWKSDVKAAPLSDEERRQRDEKRKRQAERDAKAARAKHDRAAVGARKRWSRARPASDSHPYLLLKRVKAHGLRVGAWWGFDETTGKIIKVTDCALLIPMRNQKGELRNLQAIWEIEPAEDGKQRFEKRFMSGGEVPGCSFRVGNPREVEGRMVLFVGEGYSTCMAVHESSSHAIAVAFDCANLVSIALQVRAAHPSAVIFIAADDDSHLTTNLGMKHAREAAIAVDGHIIPPPSEERMA